MTLLDNELADRMYHKLITNDIDAFKSLLSKGPSKNTVIEAFIKAMETSKKLRKD